MVREAVAVEATKNEAFLRRYTVSDANTIPKGTLLALVGDNTASATTTTSSGALFAGIAVFEKTAGDGSTEITADIGGVWDISASGAAALGHKLILANGANYVQTASIGIAGNIASGGLVVGTVLEAASDAEVVRVDLTRR